MAPVTTMTMVVVVVVVGFCAHCDQGQGFTVYPASWSVSDSVKAARPLATLTREDTVVLPDPPGPRASQVTAGVSPKWSGSSPARKM